MYITSGVLISSLYGATKLVFVFILVLFNYSFICVFLYFHVKVLHCFSYILSEFLFRAHIFVVM